MNIEELKYPIGRFENPEQFDIQEIAKQKLEIQKFPNELMATVLSLTDAQLQLCYRPDSWTIKQIIHHCADSHMNSFIRFKLALTEHNPTIKPYDENLWALLSDTKEMNIASSLQILEGLHNRWVYLMDTFIENDWKKTMYHPMLKKEIMLYESIAMYAWHGTHHLAQIKSCLK